MTISDIEKGLFHDDLKERDVIDFYTYLVVRWLWDWMS
jgi:hypothetical protein